MVKARTVQRRLWRWAFGLGLAFVAGGATGLAFNLLNDLPEVRQLENYQAGGITTIYDRQGKVLWEISAEKRRFLPLDKVPRLLQEAVLVTEDARFFEHTGIDFLGIARALLKDIYRGRLAEGGSTITQQLSKVLFLNPEKSLARKIKEALLAMQIERKYTKRQIFEMYLNQIYYGSGAYGVYQAAETFFARPPGELNLLEWCLLAGIPKNPAGYSPLYHRDKAEARARLILEKLFKAGKISAAQREAARRDKVTILNCSWEQKGGSHIRALAVRELIERFGENLVYRGNITVRTSLDADLQEVAERAVREAVEQYRRRHPVRGKGETALPEAAFYARENKSGEVLALVGGRDFEVSQFNRAVMALRQPGSAFKPIVYAVALQRGYNPSTVVGDFPVEFRDGHGGIYSPTNYDELFLGFIPLRLALEKSRNPVAVNLASKVGIQAVRQMARRLGIESPIQPNLSSALGSSALTLRELVGAYSAIAEGVRVGDGWLREVLDRNGQSLWRRKIEAQVVLEPSLAYVLSDMLRGVVLEGTGQEAADLPCWLAGKTGTTDDYRDAMFVGFSSAVAAGGWVGFDDNRSLGKGETGAVTALPMWKAFMAAHCALHNPPPPPIPEGVVMRRIDHDTGLLASERCGKAVDAAYLAGQEPRQVCQPQLDLAPLAR